MQAQHRRQLQHRFLELAEHGVVHDGRVAGLLVQQDRADHGLHVPALTEHAGDALDVIRARIRGHETLDQPFRDVGGCPAVRRERIHDDVEFLAGRRPRRNHELDAVVAEQEFFGIVVPRTKEFHRLGPAVLVTVAEVVAQREIVVVDHLTAGHRLAEAQPGKHLGHLLDDGIVVGLDGQVVGSELDRSVGVTRDQPEREQLHHLAGVILVRVVPRGRVLLLVAQVAEIGPHDGMA